LVVVFIAFGTACSGTQQTAQVDQAEKQSDKAEPMNAERNRVLPYPVEVPMDYTIARLSGTRTDSGEPGSNYWINSAEYDIDFTLHPADTMLEGSQTVVYTNNSPDTLNAVVVNLLQNLHAEGVVRNEAVEVTKGYQFSSIKINGVKAEAFNRNWNVETYAIEGTVMYLAGFDDLAPGGEIELSFEWSYKIAQQGISGRMGYNKDNLYYIGYFYPQIAVYDDVIGWHTDQFMGNAEFYADFADYTVSVTAPGNWLVYGTGELLNAEENLSEEVYNRMVEAHNSDDVMNVVSEDDFGLASTSAESEDEWLTWEFKSEKVRDVAYSATRESIWDATRTAVGDLDGDGEIDYSKINAFYRESAPKWSEVAAYSAHSIDFFSRYLAFPYPWPHMTAVEGAGIIGGGMEFPMMTVMGSYNRRSAEDLYNVTAHELAHMWMPMIANSNERRYAWMDEGATSFNENQARTEYFPGRDHDVAERGYYYRVAMNDMEGEIMRWSDYHYNGASYGVASYSKPGMVLDALRGVLGVETFNEAWQTYMDRWAYKHPYPWDMFNTFEDVSGRDLGWFWRSWYYETWTLDQAVLSVDETDAGTVIVIEDRGKVLMPVHLAITTTDGTVSTEVIPVDEWLKGKTKVTYTFPAGKEVSRVEIDPENNFPDLNPQNNVWMK